ncbi:MAG: hypothetical protein M1839_003222 [Geoglossum umbratile]|nr:MAG: hypothetical protein M1839_003222 [Geoglossum umbratile]
MIENCLNYILSPTDKLPSTLTLPQSSSNVPKLASKKIDLTEELEESGYDDECQVEDLQLTGKRLCHSDF